jgi:hypothetical protein
LIAYFRGIILARWGSSTISCRSVPQWDRRIYPTDSGCP